MAHLPMRGCKDRALLDDWHVVADPDVAAARARFATGLLGVPLSVSHGDGWRIVRDDTGEALPVRERYGFLWTSIGHPANDICAIPEAAESDRFLVTGGSIAVGVSGLRVVENFLDMGHFPFVHTGWLGVEPHTEVTPYRVETTPGDEILATECRFYQPIASPTATTGFVVDYVYKVVRPYTVCLYKSNPTQPLRHDVIYLFVQPVDEERCVAHPFLCYLKDNIDAPTIRWFMQLIFAQDKPILENQLPRRLPLDPRAETPIRADASSIHYRRWLRDHGVTYGALAGHA